MPGLRVQSHIEARCTGEVQVEVFQQVRHPADQHVTAPLLLDELERAREPAAGPAVERRHAGGIAGVTARACAASASACAATCRAIRGGAAAATGTATTRGFGERGEVYAELFRFHLHVEVERGR